MSEVARPRMLRAGDGPVSTWNVPNLITIARIVLVPVFVVLLAADGGRDGALRWAAAVLFVVAIATDGIDGHIARSRGLVTDLGKILDPIADKALTGAALVMLSVLGELPVWVTALILLREVGITVFRFAVLRTRVIPASRGGKLKTVLQSVAITLALLPLATLVGSWIDVVDVVLMAAALVVTVVTGVQYLIDDRRANRS
ncbi:CDP-diacylglycerol--glycerol-3-phosphate 3-phosphatidyltransferase [Amnibacterium sp. CER49]|uniref:CDP-diacylglycerol--glycerol-3-phosphate 3-phosphatidyltransferase n=1 Tax=Amnibacterium sp. CER49 TaxID=3039161 RepID=UPI002449C4D0|nr:CDP-diacylglycerol--glycerol-3-phosphate 3-phosphatidyltransferase [Amnibacterium sp. CER49]MDH2444998.1 CDP-diacylglycerol--glycerol-3-phosphate 3-phosphatidyltransferase [Amnibacterium sp. CER49]